MNNLIQEQVEHHLQNKILIEKAIVEICQKIAEIDINKYFLTRFNDGKFDSPTFTYHDDDPIYVKEGNIGVSFGIYEYQSYDAEGFNFPLLYLWEETWEEEYSKERDEKIAIKEEEATQKTISSAIKKEEIERKTLAELKTKYE